MQPMTAADIRRAFLEFFRERGHAVVPSSSLVPADDPTLLFTNAGMVQFKDVFTGKAEAPYTRAASAQKCVRAGGKHNDLENVGKTARHHTFFEMLGNFSFGDYFKREAIGYAWTFLTDVLGLPRDRLYATIYKDDDEAFALWREVAGVPAERIVRLGEKDNFWAMGDTGPCGPCSEIVIDRGGHLRCDAPECFIGECDCDRWLEIWNLVFMQYERSAGGALTPLPRPSIDTGMGLERIASVLQGVATNFDTDLFTPYIRQVEEMTGRRCAPGPEGFPFRVIADHARACAFLIGDGVLPSNEGRGYVLRRILRRAVRFGRVLGLDAPFLHRLAPTVAEVMGDAYPEVRERLDLVQRVIRGEEERFHQTLDQGMRLLGEITDRMRREGRRVLSGDEAFLLYDTFGFPLDLLQDVCEEEGLELDRAGFEEAMEAQRRRARADREEKGEGLAGVDLGRALAGLEPTRFVGYERLASPARVLAVARGEERVGEAAAGQEVAVVLDETPFYAESGGQVGDAGWLEAPGLRVAVSDTKPFGRGLTLHLGRVEEGVLAEGRTVTARVDAARRAATARNHSATHLLHKALKVVLGEHVNQAGSLVAPDRLRFDFTHFGALTPEELRRVEALVNEEILAALPVETEVMALDAARARGAMALFGEKYGDEVRVVRMGDFSLELCGGTHLRNTAEAGLFKIVSEESVGAGVRRIEAVTGMSVLAYLWREEEALRQAAAALKGRPEEVPARIEELIERLRRQEREIAELQSRLARNQGEELLASAREVAGVRVVVGEAPVADPDALRELGDFLRDRLGSGVVILGARQNGKALLLAMVTRDLVERGLHAGRIVGEAARVAGGGGGGRPDMAQAGGRSPEKLAEALAAGVDAVRRQMDG